MGTLGLAVVSVVLLVGCSNVSVKHMRSILWKSGEAQTLALRYWRFDFEAVPFQESFGIRGAATPILDEAPAWAVWIDDLSIAAYLCDANGRILGQAQKAFLPGQLNAQTSVPFEFIMEAEEPDDPRGIYVTFGYRMVLTDGVAQPAATLRQGEAEPHVFFASEGALNRI